MNDAPQIRKAKRIKGRTLVFCDASAADAEFILKLRLDERRSRHLLPTSPSLDDQVRWLDRYAKRENEAYFIIYGAVSGDRLGTVRLLDGQGDSFCWGSWVLKPSAPAAAAIESALMVYAYGINTLGFRCCHFRVRRDNQRVRAFHERFGAVVELPDDEEDVYYTLSNQAIRASMRRFDRYLPDPITVEP